MSRQSKMRRKRERRDQQVWNHDERGKRVSKRKGPAMPWGPRKGAS